MYSTYLAGILMTFIIHPPMYDNSNMFDIWQVGCRALHHGDLCSWPMSSLSQLFEFMHLAEAVVQRPPSDSKISSVARMPCSILCDAVQSHYKEWFNIISGNSDTALLTRTLPSFTTITAVICSLRIQQRLNSGDDMLMEEAVAAETKVSSNATW